MERNNEGYPLCLYVEFSLIQRNCQIFLNNYTGESLDFLNKTDLSVNYHKNMLKAIYSYQG